VGVPCGLLLANGVLLVIDEVMDDATFRSWGWRIAFFLSFILIIVGLVIRTMIAESPGKKKRIVFTFICFACVSFSFILIIGLLYLCCSLFYFNCKFTSL
jgi:MFS family permease